MGDALRVMVVDDSRVSRILSSAILKALRPDSEVFEAANGDEALQVYAREKPDLCVLDMNMPGMNGLELAKEIRSLTPDAWIALLTANVQSAIRQRAEGQSVKFFRKPITQEVIGEILMSFEKETIAS